MDWARAKNILIAVLLVLNVFLTSAIIARLTGGGADRELYSGVDRILSDRGITMLCEFPKNIKDSGQLMYGDGARYVENCAKALNGSGAKTSSVEILGRESLRYVNPSPGEGLNTESLPALDDSIRKIFSEWGVDLTRYVTDCMESANGGGFYYRYILKINERLIFDSNIQVYIDMDGGVTDIAMSYREIKPDPLETLISVIPAYQVIIRNYYVSGTAIASIDLGYLGRNTARENPFIESEEGAVWRVILDDGSERFFEAAYGEEVLQITPYV